jgi:putative transposase
MKQLQKLTFHVTAKTKDEKWINTPMPKMWKNLQKQINSVHQLFNLDIISFVLMRNHYHLLCKTSYKELNALTNSLFPEIYSQKKVKVISSKKYLYNCYKYVYQNPQRAKVVNRIQDYPYSTLFDLAKGKTSLYPIVDKLGSPDDYKLYWLNQPITNNEARELRDIDAVKD